MTTNRDPWGKPYSHYAYQDKNRGRFFKKASAETQTKRRNQAKYESNICPECFTARAIATGKCNCEEGE